MAKFSSVYQRRRWSVLVVIWPLFVQVVLGGEREGVPVAAAYSQNAVVKETVPIDPASGVPSGDNRSEGIEAGGDNGTAKDETKDELQGESELAPEEQLDNDVAQQGLLAGDPPQRAQRAPADRVEASGYGVGGTPSEVAEEGVINEAEEADEGNMRAGQALPDSSIASDATPVPSKDSQPAQSGSSGDLARESAAQHVDQGAGEEGHAEPPGSPQERTDEPGEEEATEVPGAVAEEDDSPLPASPQEGNDESEEVEATEVSGAAAERGDSTSPGSSKEPTNQVGEGEAEESEIASGEHTPFPAETDAWEPQEDEGNSVDVVDDVEDQPTYPVRPSKRGLLSSFGSKAALALAVTAGLAYAGARGIRRSRRSPPPVQKGPEWIEMHEFVLRMSE